jgi:hypothetical protein
MEIRIDVVLTPENKEAIFQAIKDCKEGIPYLVKLTDEDHRSLHKMDEGCRPFVQKCLELASKNEALDPGSDLLKGAANDVNLYLFLAKVENQLRQLLEMVADTKLLAGSEAYDIARVIFMKAKMNVKLGVPDSQPIADDLGKLYKPTCTHTHLITLH